MLQPLPYSNELVFALSTAKSIARDYRHNVYSGVHILRALLYEEVLLEVDLKARGVDVAYIKEWSEVRLFEFPKAMGASSEILPDSIANKLLNVADGLRLRLNEDQISPLHVLIALSRKDVVFNEEQLKTFPITEKELLEFVSQNGGIASVNPEEELLHPSSKASKNRKGGSLKTIDRFCIDKTSLAKEGKIDPIIGRDGEIRMMSEILSRRTKSNVIIVGDPGVGKTALVEGFALNIVNGEVPGKLKEAKVLELDVGALIAGASYKGELEDRLKNVIREIKLMDNVILFIDEIHMLLGTSMGNGTANMLKPELARGELKVIGATTNDEYRKYIQKDDAFERRFTPLMVEEPNEETAVRMLRAILPKYETHHQLTVARLAIEQCVKLAKRYMTERQLPDAAVDLMDRTMAAIQLMQEGSEEIIEALLSDLDNIIKDNVAGEESYFKELLWFEGQMQQRLSPILLNQIEEEEEVINQIKQSPKEFGLYLGEKLQKLKGLLYEKIEIIDPSHVASLVSYATGIPIGKIQTKERDRLLNIESVLQKRVIGQDHALIAVADAIRNARSGLKEAGEPVASFFFLGPTGTGKTELAKAMASFLFNDEKALIRFDMSEFKGKESESALLGAPPGFVGYEEGGPLINKIRERPYSIVLFDEIEKADKGVFDVFLSILDEGKATDRQNREGDFSNAIIIFTSNIGHYEISNKFRLGETPSANFIREQMVNFFRPEFLGRIERTGELVPFAPIKEEVILKIFSIHFNKLVKRMKSLGMILNTSQKVKWEIAMSGYSEELGVRPLLGEIRRQLNRPLSRMIIEGKIQPGSSVYIDLDENKELVWQIEP